jgi:5'-3' exonuclease
MGVKGLFQFLKRFEKNIYIPQYVEKKSVGIDIFWYIHKSKGDMFSFQNLLLPIIKNAQKVHCVFDGSVPEYKKGLVREQQQKRNEILQSIQQIEQFLKYPFNRLNNEDRRCIREYLNELKLQAWYPTAEYIDTVKSWLSYKSCEIYIAKEEADTLLIELEQKNIIDIIITNDSDLLILGSSTILRPYSPLKGCVFNTSHICNILGFTAQQWKDFMYLCQNMKEKDILLAYSLISVYKDLDYALQKYDSLYADNLIICE